MARILIIDDDPGVRGSVRKILEIQGHEVDVAADGFSGMAMHATRRYDVIVTDLRMPDFDGIEVIINVRRLDSKVRFVLMSGGEYRNSSTDAAELGSVWVLAKPFTIKQLTGLVHRIIEVPPSSPG